MAHFERKSTLIGLRKPLSPRIDSPRPTPNTSPYGKFPGCPGTEKEDILQALLHFPGNIGFGVSIFRSIQCLVPNLYLNVDDTLELPIVWALAVAWNSLWDLRQKQT